MNLSTLVAVCFLIYGSIVFVRHRRPTYKGNHQRYGGYKYTSPLKHDIMKYFTTEMFALFVLGLSKPDEPFLDIGNIWESKLVHILLAMCGTFVYYEIVEPYLVDLVLPDL